MGLLDLKNEPTHAVKIRKALSRRGLKFDEGGDWEIHGPHDQMDYQVYVGSAYREADPEAWFDVAIYPHAVYEIESSDEWTKDARPENRNPI